MVSFSFFKGTNQSGEIHVENGTFHTLHFYHVIQNSSTLDPWRKGSATGACTNTIAMYDFFISYSTVVQVNEMVLSLIFSTSHFSWSPSLSGSTLASWQKMSMNWCFYTSLPVRDIMLPAVSHSFWNSALAGNTTTCLQKMFMNWCFHAGVLLEEIILSATSHSS